MQDIIVIRTLTHICGIITVLYLCKANIFLRNVYIHIYRYNADCMCIVCQFIVIRCICVGREKIKMHKNKAHFNLFLTLKKIHIYRSKHNIINRCLLLQLMHWQYYIQWNPSWRSPLNNGHLRYNGQQPWSWLKY